jgi:hypothetical protein
MAIENLLPVHCQGQGQEEHALRHYIEGSVTYTEHAKRKTVTSLDVRTETIRAYTLRVSLMFVFVCGHSLLQFRRMIRSYFYCIPLIYSFLSFMCAIVNIETRNYFLFKKQKVKLIQMF